MTQRGRKSAGDLAAVSRIPERPKPPRGLSQPEKQVWLRVVGALPIDWFGAETHDLLVQYCSHVVDARKIRRQYEALDSDAPATEMEFFLKAQERETRAINALARSMRMSQQSTYSAEKTKGNRASGKSWKTL